MQQLNAAYAALSDPVRRAQYAAQYRQAERLPSRESPWPRRLTPMANQAGLHRRARPASRTAIVLGAAVLSALLITFWLLGDLLDEPPSAANLADPAAVHQLVLNSR
jgi:curved DNA-binding protein CbpA